MYTKDWYRREWQKAKKGRAWYKSVYVITNRENKELKAKIANLEYRIKELEMKYETTK
jgi:hypothetical protein